MTDKMNHPVIQAIRNERTYVMMKPDGVKRGLTGEVLSRIHNAGLKVIALKMVNATEDQIRSHYPMQDQEWVDGLGDKGLGTFKKLGLDAKEFLGTDNKSEIGRSVAEGLVDYMQSGPVVCMIVEGIGAIDIVRKMVGATLPFKAEPGTIRGDFSVDSPAIANVMGRAIQNVVHASVVADEAAHEISIWFNEDEVKNYKIVGEDVMYGKTY